MTKTLLTLHVLGASGAHEVLSSSGNSFSRESKALLANYILTSDDLGTAFAFLLNWLFHNGPRGRYFPGVTKKRMISKLEEILQLAERRAERKDYRWADRLRGSVSSLDCILTDSQFQRLEKIVEGGALPSLASSALSLSPRTMLNTKATRS